MCQGSQPSKFVHLHCHSAYSLLDGMSRPEEIVEKVKANGQAGFAITEHGNVFSSVKLYKLAKANNLKFVYGIEFYITDDRFKKDKTSKYNHLTVLAKNEQGRLNINKLASLGYLEGFYYKPRIDHELLLKHKEGLVVLSGCMASEFQQALAGGKIGDNDVHITSGNIEKAKEVARKYRNWFGEDYYLEIQSHRDPRQQKLNRAIVDIAKELNIPYVVTADSHFADANDYELHSIFIQIGQNREAGETYQDTHLQSEQEAREILSISLTDEEIDHAINNTIKILDMCNVDVPISAPLIPHVDVPEEFGSEEAYIKHLIREGWKRRGIHKLPKEKQKVYKERLQYEFNAIKEMGFIGYFLLVHSYVNVVKRRGIARGSAGGSLISYLLNIVDIDPVKYGLYFERFIDVGQLDLLKQGIITEKELKIPDIDSDLGTQDREKVIDFIVNKYGKNKVAALGQFGFIWDKTAIKDVGRVLGIDFDTLNQITKEIGDDTIQEAIDDGRMDKWLKKYPKLFEYAPKLAGLPRSFGKHPCGKVVTIDDVTSYTAVALSDDEITLQLDMKDAEELGLVKIDTLGLRTVDVIYDTLEMIGKDYDYIDPNKMNFEDEKVLNIFRNGFTDNIFQFESEPMKNTLKKMQPSGLEDIAVANALYRPGSMRFIDNYIDRKFGREKFEYLHPDLEPILKNTYGIIVFQEQLIQIGRLAGMRNPDLLRKATGKKIPELMEQCKDELYEGLVNKRGWTKEQVDQLWDIMVEFSKYSFNRSHSFAYSILAYICAFLKAYHPTEFICATLNSYALVNNQDKMDKLATTFYEAKRLGVQFEQPTFRNPTALCKIENGKIVYGIELIKHCNKQNAEDLSKLKDRNYTHFVDLLKDIEEETTINQKQLSILINLGYFNEFGSQQYLNKIHEEFISGKNKYNKALKDTTKNKRLAALKEFEDQLEDNFKEDIYNKISFEKEYLGFVWTTYPNLPKSVFCIMDIDKKYTPKLTLYQLKTGKERVIKVNKNKFYDNNNQDRFLVGDILQISEIEFKPKLKKEGDKWVETDEKEPYLERCAKINL